MRSFEATSLAPAWASASARRRSSSRSSDSRGSKPLARGARVDGADGDLEQVALERVEAVGVVAGAVVADQQRVQADQVGDLLRRRPGRVRDVPGVDGVLVLGAADREMARAGNQRAEEGVVAGTVEHVAAHAVRQAARQDHVDGERLAAAALGVDQQRAVVVRRVERVEQLDGAARLGEAERDARRRAAAGADQRQAVADVAGDVLARQPRHVAAQRQRRLPQLGLAQLALVHARVGGGRQAARRLLDRLGELDRVGVGAALADRLVDRQLVDGGPLGAGQLLEQLGGLLLLRQHLVVGRHGP